MIAGREWKRVIPGHTFQKWRNMVPGWSRNTMARREDEPIWHLPDDLARENHQFNRWVFSGQKSLGNDHILWKKWKSGGFWKMFLQTNLLTVRPNWEIIIRKLAMFHYQISLLEGKLGRNADLKHHWYLSWFGLLVTETDTSWVKFSVPRTSLTWEFQDWFDGELTGKLRAGMVKPWCRVACFPWVDPIRKCIRPPKPLRENEILYKAGWSRVPATQKDALLL